MAQSKAALGGKVGCTGQRWPHGAALATRGSVGWGGRLHGAVLAAWGRVRWGGRPHGALAAREAHLSCNKVNENMKLTLYVDHLMD